MWPFSSSASSSSSPSQPSGAPPTEFAAVPALPASSVATPAPSFTQATAPPPVPGPSGPTPGNAVQGAGSADQPDQSFSAQLKALDGKAAAIVLSGFALATGIPSFFKMPPKGPDRLGTVIITWVATSYVLVQHLTEKFKQEEFDKWEAARLRDAKNAPIPGAGFEGGFGGQESLRDKYATTSGEH